MKKFTIMLMAAFIAVATWAQPMVQKNHQVLPEQFAVKTAKDLKQFTPVKKEMTPRQAFNGKVQVPVQKRHAKKTGAKKSMNLTALLGGEPTTFLVKSNAYTMENIGTAEYPDYQLEPANLFRVSEFWTMTLDAETNIISITGIDGEKTFITGTFDPANSRISIPYGQILGTNDYGNYGMASASGEENLVGKIEEDAIVFYDIWVLKLLDGDNAGTPFSDYYVSTAVLPNGMMAWDDKVVDVDIDFNEDTYIATVWNFGDEGVAIDVCLKPNNKFIIQSQLAYEGGSTYGDFYTYSADFETSTISGTGTEDALTFDSEWTFLAPSTGYYLGRNGAATITYAGTFAYPVLTEFATTPATPSVTFFDYWNGENATVKVNVPCVDVDGNDIIRSLLSYQLYTTDEEGNVVALGAPIAYDDEEYGTGDTKTVVLGEEAKGLTVIGVKSIYTAAGETNESELSEWFEIPQIVVVPDGLDTKTYPVTADAYNGSWDTYTGTVEVGVDGTDVYIQGILPHCPNGWAKGTIDENGVVTFPIQLVGTYNGDYIYLAAYDSNTGGLKDVTFTYNANEDMYVSEAFILANSNPEKLGFYYPYFDGMTIGTETIPELVELPEGAEVVEYPFVGTIYSSGSSTEFESTVNVAVVGDDVYVQGLNEYVPEVWVKGTKDAETGNIIFPTGQNFGGYETSSSTYQFFMVGYDEETDAIVDVVMTYNEEQNFYRLENDLIVNENKTSISYYTWYEAGSTIGIQKLFDATFNFNALGTEEEPWPVSSSETTDGDITEPIEFAADNVTLAISPKDENYTTPNRFWGTTAGPQLRVYSGTLTFSVPAGNNITEIVFNHNGRWGANTVNDMAIPNDADAKAATWTGEAQTVVVSIAANSQINSIDVTYAAKLLPPMKETEAPDDLETADWALNTVEMVYYEEEVDEETGNVISEAHTDAEAYDTSVQVGFYTVTGDEGTEVYIQGLCPELPKAWVKGSLIDGKVTIPASTFFGVYEYIDWDVMSFAEDNLFLTAADFNDDNTVTLTDLVFDYDAEAHTLSSTQSIYVNADRRELSGNYYHWYEGMVLTPMPDVAAIPANPTLEKFIINEAAGYSKIYASIPTTDVDDNSLMTSKLYYSVYYENLQGEHLYTFTADSYGEDFDEDVTEIPYEHDGYDIYKGGEVIYFEEEKGVLVTWKKIGIQSIYYGGGERNVSNIVWMDNPAYDPDAYIKGDANGDGVVDVADVVAIVNNILEKPAENFNEAAADVNGDNVVDAADVVLVVNIILDKGEVDASRVRAVLRDNGFIF